MLSGRTLDHLREHWHFLIYFFLNSSGLKSAQWTFNCGQLRPISFTSPRLPTVETSIRGEEGRKPTILKLHTADMRSKPRAFYILNQWEFWSSRTVVSAGQEADNHGQAAEVWCLEQQSIYFLQPNKICLSKHWTTSAFSFWEKWEKEKKIFLYCQKRSSMFFNGSSSNPKGTTFAR